MKVLVTGGAGHGFPRTGAGFGGCSIAFLPAGEMNELSDTILQAFSKSGFEEPAFHVFLPAAGAEVAR